jgi:hypothetical protein
VELSPHAIESESSLLLGLEATVHVQLGLRAGREEAGEGRDDEEENRQDDDQLDECVAVAAAQSSDEAEDHLVCAST